MSNSCPCVLILAVCTGVFLSSCKHDEVVRDPIDAARADEKGGRVPDSKNAAVPDYSRSQLARALIENRNSDAKLLAALNQKITVRWVDTPLVEVIRELSDGIGTNIVIDERALAENGIATDEPITHSFEQVNVGHILDRILPTLHLTHVVRGGVLEVTTKDDEEWFEFQAYSIAEFVDHGGNADKAAEILQEATAGCWFELDGMGGIIERRGEVLLIRQTKELHAEVRSVLKALNEIVAREEPFGAIPLGRTTANDAMIFEQFGRVVSVDYHKMPLEKVAADLSARVEFSIKIDDAKLHGEGISSDEPIDCRLTDVTVLTVLLRIIEPLGVAIDVREGAVWITTDDSVAPSTFVYDVRDLVSEGDIAWEVPDILMDNTSGPWIEIDGRGGAVIDVCDNMLFIRHTPIVQMEVALLLDDLRSVWPTDRESTRWVTEVYGLLFSGKGDEVEGLETRWFDAPEDRLAQLAKAIPSFVAPETWRRNGGKGAIEQVGATLVIRQTPRVHRKIDRFVTRLRWGFRRPLGDAPFERFHHGFGSGSGGGYFSVRDGLRPKSGAASAVAAPEGLRDK